MIVQQEFLGKIKDLGINSYEAKLWTALLSKGVATAGELSDIANVPRSRSYDVLESLERKGFIVMKLGKPIKYIAVPPQEVVERVKSKIQEEAVRQDKLIDSLKGSDILEQLTNIHETGSEQIDPTEMTGVVKGRVNVISHIAYMLKGAKKGVDVVLPKERSEFLEDIRRAVNKASRNGVKTRVVSTEKLTTTKTTTTKQHKNANFFFILVDKKNLLFMPLSAKHSPENDFGVWISNESFAQNFSNIFESYWEKAV